MLHNLRMVLYYSPKAKDFDLGIVERGEASLVGRRRNREIVLLD